MTARCDSHVMSQRKNVKRRISHHTVKVAHTPIAFSWRVMCSNFLNRSYRDLYEILKAMDVAQRIYFQRLCCEGKVFKCKKIFQRDELAEYEIEDGLVCVGKIK